MRTSAPHERARAHARAAEILADSGASEERIAAQLVEAEPNAEAERVELLRRVASRRTRARRACRGRCVPEARARGAAATVAMRPEVLLELGSAELRLAMPEAVDALGGCGRDDPATANAGRLRYASSPTRTQLSGNADGAVAALESAIAVVEREDRELALRSRGGARGQGATGESRGSGARRRSDSSGTASSRELRAANAWCSRASRSSKPDRASRQAKLPRHIERGLGGGRLIDEQDVDVVGPFYALVLGLLATDALDLAETSIERALAAARARASIPAMAFLLAHRGWFSLTARRRGASGG